MAYLLWHVVTESAKKYPNKPAVKWRDKVYTYRELDEESNKLACLLTKNGIKRGDRVGIFMPKSERSVVSMLGILKAGATYVPIDPNAPSCRVAYILNNCSVSGLIAIGTHFEKINNYLAEIPSLHTMVLADNHQIETPNGTNFKIDNWETPSSINSSQYSDTPTVENDPAYILYTSGSTGNPKGVILSHRHALTFVDWGANTFSVDAEDRLSNIAPLHFDLSVFDLYVAFRCGACVVIAPDDISLFPIKLSQWIIEEQITIWYSVPSVLIRLLLHGQLEQFEYKKLHTVLYAGESFPVKHLRKVMNCMQHSKFYNLYGPTETNVCTYYELPNVLDQDITDIPIGSACANTEVFAIGENNQIINPGETGELYVKGATLMLGYWGLSDKTTKTLVTNHLQSNYLEPVYRTGDIVRLETAGYYTYIGRKDHMIKSRGYRIELGDIEQALYQHNHIKETGIVAIPDDEIGSRIIAIIVSDSNVELTAEELRSFCLERLPNYMIPEEFIFQYELPRTSTGKVDRMALLKNYQSNEKE